MRIAQVRKRGDGFTYIEIMIIIVVIAILATLVWLTRASVDQKRRDNIRRNDIDNIYSKLESYQAASGKYPTLADMNSNTFRTTYLKGLDKESLKDPSNSAVDGSQYYLISQPQKDAYSYQVTPDNCDNKSINCTGYTLTAILENGSTYVKQALY